MKKPFIILLALALCTALLPLGGLGVFSAFGLASARHSALLDRLKKLESEQEVH